MENSNEDGYACPSFSSYSSNRLAEIAVKVVAENTIDRGGEDEDEFEFALVREDSKVFADEFLNDGLNAPVFPVFNHDLLRKDRHEFISDSGRRCLESSITIPLSKLVLDDGENQELDNPPSCSSSDHDELENIPADTYCVWRPKTIDQPSPTGCKKSKSTGSVSKRWNLRDLLRRSNSEGKDSFVLLTPKKREEKSPIGVPKKAKKGKKVGGGGSGGGGGGSAGRVSTSAHEALYVRNRAIKEEHMKKSFLPYRRDLVGFFVNAKRLE